MLAYCGINCDECISYKGTITGDITLLEKMNEEFGDGKTDAIDFVCLGCKFSDLKLIATDCSRCLIRSCAKAKGKDFCATCDDFETCDFMKPYRGDGTLIRDKMNAFLRKKYDLANS